MLGAFGSSLKPGFLNLNFRRIQRRKGTRSDLWVYAEAVNLFHDGILIQLGNGRSVLFPK